MGDPHSPGMTLAACGWMEHKWMQSLTMTEKREFKAARYMDDILLIHTDKVDPSILQDGEVYQEPLKLETVNDNTFLETLFVIHKDNSYAHWIKMLIRYASHLPYGDMRISKVTVLIRRKLGSSKLHAGSYIIWLVTMTSLQLVEYRSSKSL